MHCHHIIAIPWCKKYNKKARQIYIFNRLLDWHEICNITQSKNVLKYAVKYANSNACGLLSE